MHKYDDAASAAISIRTPFPNNLTLTAQQGSMRTSRETVTLPAQKNMRTSKRKRLNSAADQPTQPTFDLDSDAVSNSQVTATNTLQEGGIELQTRHLAFVR